MSWSGCRIWLQIRILQYQTVNAIAPGFIKTEILDSIDSSKLEEMAKNIPIGRIGAPEDISKLVSFLASDESSYITGQVLHVNGGLTL